MEKKQTRAAQLKSEAATSGAEDIPSAERVARRTKAVTPEVQATEKKFDKKRLAEIIAESEVTGATNAQILEVVCGTLEVQSRHNRTALSMLGQMALNMTILADMMATMNAEMKVLRRLAPLDTYQRLEFTEDSTPSEITCDCGDGEGCEICLPSS